MKKRDYKSFDFKSVFELSEESPTGLVWKVPRMYPAGLNYSRVGKPAGSKHNNHKRETSYYTVGVFGTSFLVHRVIMAMINVTLPVEMDIDHIDGNGLNNSLNNLRVVTSSLNCQNRLNQRIGKELATGVYLEEYLGRTGTPLSKIRAHYSKNDKVISRSWSIFKRGYKKSLELAIDWRKEQIDKLNRDGACYTDRHGT